VSPAVSDWMMSRRSLLKVHESLATSFIDQAVQNGRDELASLVQGGSGNFSDRRLESRFVLQKDEASSSSSGGRGQDELGPGLRNCPQRRARVAERRCEEMP